MDNADSVERQPMLDPLVTVIVPVFNEACTINEIIARVMLLPFRKEVLVVDDGSTDETKAKLRCWQDDPNVRVISHATNQGKGTAIRTAIRSSSGTFVLIQDADLEYAPEELAQVLAPLIAGKARVVYGSRYMEGAPRHPHLISHYGVQFLNCLIRILYRVRLSDHATCYKAFRTDLLRRMDLQCKRFEFCTEVTAKSCRLGVPIMEVPISYVPRSYEHGKKIGVVDGVRALICLFQHRFWQESSVPAATESFHSNVSAVSNLL